MNPQTLAEAQELFNFENEEAKKYGNIKTVICPPFLFIEELAKFVNKNIGAQDIFWEESGAFTGEISAGMLKRLGVGHVLVGHSDRRYVLGETDEMINKKIKAALADGIIPILLVGERNREENKKEVLNNQLSADLTGLSEDEIKKIFIAYEPVWAISTTPGAEADTPENTLESSKIIVDFLIENWELKIGNLPGILYGGSVTDKNVSDFLSHPEISGAVIGGASLNKKEFANILKIVASL